jgi:hypothetical protein
MIEWLPVVDSERIVAEAFLPDQETILVRFPDGVEWSYSACSATVWGEFTAPTQSRGEFIARVLDAKPNGRWAG